MKVVLSRDTFAPIFDVVGSENVGGILHAILQHSAEGRGGRDWDEGDSFGESSVNSDRIIMDPSDFLVLNYLRFWTTHHKVDPPTDPIPSEVSLPQYDMETETGTEKTTFKLDVDYCDLFLTIDTLKFDSSLTDWLESIEL